MSDDPTAKRSALTREAILAALQSLSEELGRKGLQGELCLFGGTVMVLAYAARVSTKDVDAVFQPAPALREAAKRVAESRGLDADWLNDGVKGFLSARHQITTGSLPQFENLRLSMPVPEYLLAMKCMAARLGGPGGEQIDIPDIVHLIKHLELKSAEAVLNVVENYYPANRIPVKTKYLIEGLFTEGTV
jgi:predicted nucleotidyltransferase